MQRGQIFSRVLMVIGGLLLLGIVLRLITAILEPVLPGFLMHDLGAGWTMLYEIISPAMPPVMAALILAAICWVIIGRSR